MKIYLNENVYEMALKRIERVFNEMEEVIVSISGGKDSTVVFYLCLEVAKKLKKLPLKVAFLDQEAEWQCVIDTVEEIMTRDDVEPYWFQVPIKLFNATSMENPWLNCWAEGEKWMRDKHPISIKKNEYGCDRFKDSFTYIARHYFPDKKIGYIAGMRANESNSRKGIIHQITYKDISWGKILTKEKHFTFYPIYDWDTSDVWKYIHSNKHPYCKLYDFLYQKEIPIFRMRVSNLHHETAVHSLFYLHEVEPHTWEALVERLGGIHTTKHIEKKEMFQVGELPFMFKDWKEYRDYLTQNLIQIDDYKKTFTKRWKADDEKYEGKMKSIETLFKKQVASILANDWEFVKYDAFVQNNPSMIALNMRLKGRYSRKHDIHKDYILEGYDYGSAQSSQ